MQSFIAGKFKVTLALAGAGFGEGSDAHSAQIRQQWQHCCPWCRIEISRTLFKLDRLPTCYPHRFTESN